MSPILPIHLNIKKPKSYKYPDRISSVGDELRTARLDRNLTQLEVAQQIGVNRNFVYECELNHRTNSIFALHKIYLFLDYIPKTLNIDEATLRGKLYTTRIKNGFSLYDIAKKTGLDKSTIGRFEKGKLIKKESLKKIEDYLK
ncbi:helix-turn-helix protein [Lutibacter oceani]|uniref:Helix-turn-helix protein n=1 Tax=Lutibacter oceani TaxID=1853311 RepID=A0A3D9RM92_9FLAO|nr:helix-turn-helix transcriptional regulator [Lutibacter oceani]REE80678.1 helix-turn-helix protein [Lutibacter oceani]